jgi:hypothetical protein
MMVSRALHSYFRINTENYAKLVDRLLSETNRLSPTSDDRLRAARKGYFEAAIAKGADITDLVAEIQSIHDAKVVEKAAQNLPDKESLGWKGSQVSLSERDRAGFSAAAKKRSPEMRWDNLFPKGQDDLILPLSETAQSFDDLIERFLNQHNVRAVELLKQARDYDAMALARDPLARPTAGRDIAQRLIKLAPVNVLKPKEPLKLQSLNPNKEGEVWESGPKFAKYLQDSFEWGLYDIFQMGRVGADKQKLSSFTTRRQKNDVKLEDLTDRSVLPIDTYLDAGDFKVIISRDPQKIGEMSTGQRWLSCMASDGINYHFVPRDISAGTLVAYVVHKDDTEARYPLMRQLIKPFRNSTGEVILVPAKIYGGGGLDNSRTRDALTLTLNEFVKKQNIGKSGEFKMDSHLYADGQSVAAMLQSQWSDSHILDAVLSYRSGSITEWMTELSNILKSVPEWRSPSSDETAKTETFRKKIFRAYCARDTEVGLPRMFFRATSKSSIGVVPPPRDIQNVVVNNNLLLASEDAFKALVSENHVLWSEYSRKLPLDVRAQMSLAALVSAERGSSQEQFAADRWGEEAKLLSVASVIDTAKAYSWGEKSLLNKTALAVVTDYIQSQKDAKARVEAASEVIIASGSENYVNGDFRKCAHTLGMEQMPKLPTISERMAVAKRVIFNETRGGVPHEIYHQALKFIENHISELPDATDRLETAALVLKSVGRDSDHEALAKISHSIISDGANSPGWILSPILSVLKWVTEAGANGTTLSNAAYEGLKRSAPNVILPGGSLYARLSKQHRGVFYKSSLEKFLITAETLTGGVTSAGFFIGLSSENLHWTLPAAAIAATATFALELAKDVSFAAGKSLHGGAITELVHIYENTYKWAIRTTHRSSDTRAAMTSDENPAIQTRPSAKTNARSGGTATNNSYG